MYNRIYKNYQVNMGSPIRVKLMEESICQEEIDIDIDSLHLENNETPEKILKNARAEAEKIIALAREEAEQMLLNAQDKIAEHMRDVEEEAKQEGFCKGEDEALNKHRLLLDEAQELKNKAEHDYKMIIDSLEAEIINLVLDISQKVINKTIEEEKGYIVSLIEEGLFGCQSHQNVTIKVSAQDYDFVLEALDDIKKAFGGMNIELFKDLSLNKGDCILEDEFGTTDNSCNTKFQEIKKEFLKVVEGNNDKY